MPLYDPNHIEYTIATGNIEIVLEDGRSTPAYWAYPTLGLKFPAVALIHDWWGMTTTIRRIANLLAQSGHYVIVPDLFDGRAATTPQEAMTLVSALGEKGGYPRIDRALSVLERHNNCNSSVAAVGFGMGGSLAFEAAIKRKDLEAAVAFGGFPQRYFGQFSDATTPILAFYGQHEPHIKAAELDRLRLELAAGTPHHRVEVIPGLAHDFFFDHPTEQQRESGRLALRVTMDFLDQYLTRPTRPQVKRY